MFEERGRDIVLPCAFSYDGAKLENQFRFYRTLSVKGRGVTNVQFETDQVKTGTKIATQKLSGNTLQIEYLMYYASQEDVQNQQRKMKQFLFREADVPIVFDDDPQIIQYGRLSKFDEDDGSVYRDCFKGRFEIYCQDPLKYSMPKQSENTITVASPVETTPSKIIVKLVRDSSVRITNINTGKVIRITSAAIYANNVLTFDFNQGIVLVNGKDMTSVLDLESDFENFYVHRGDQLKCDNGTMTIYTQEVYL